MKEKTFTKLRSILGFIAGLSDTYITEHSSLYGDLKLRAMDFGEICLRISSSFDISFMDIENVVFMETCSVEELCDKIDTYSCRNSRW